MFNMLIHIAGASCLAEAWFLFKDKDYWRVAIYIVAGLICLGPDRVQAKDVMIILNDQEQTALRRVLDSATKSEGIQVAPITVYLLNKLNSAMEVVEHKDNSDQPKDKSQ
jgi:hypothetical protein